jgi:carbon monoxide dehydrogenase subunit G
MQLEHSFTVPVGIDEAWKVLLDIERIAPCMPGAAVDTIDGDDFTGTVKVKLGPIALTYKGKASFVEKDEAAHRAVISAQGRDARGNGTASAKVSATLSHQGDGTKVDVVTDLDITGKPAQFGRGVMVDVGNKLIGQFADCLAGKLTSGGAPAEASAGAAAPAAGAASATKAAAKKAPARKSAAKAAPAAPATPAEASPAEAAPAEAAPADAARASDATPAADATPAPDAAPAEATSTDSGPAEATSGAAAPAAGEVSAPAPAPAAQSGPRQIPTADVEPIDLLESAGPALAKRLAPLLAALLVVLAILRRHRH